MHEYLRTVSVSGTLLCAIIALWVLSRFGIIAEQTILIDQIGNWLTQRGILALWCVSVLENTVAVNTYFPGSLAILTAMASTQGDITKAVLAWVSIYLGALVGLYASYFIGRSLSTAPTIQNSKLKSALTFWHPYLASISCMQFGAARIPFASFSISTLPIATFWNLFWGVAMYNFGNFLGGSQSFVYFINGYIILLFALDNFRFFKKYDMNV
jgi:membrane protein DedA with SNARE-associated domain